MTHDIQCRQCHELKDELERLHVLAVEYDQLNATLAERLASEQQRFTIRCSELKRQRDSAIAEAKTIIRQCVAAAFRNSRISEDTHEAGIRWLSAHGVEM